MQDRLMPPKLFHIFEDVIDAHIQEFMQGNITEGCYIEPILTKAHSKILKLLLTVLEVKEIQNTLCQECKVKQEGWCQYTCSIIANAITKAQKEKLNEKSKKEE